MTAVMGCFLGVSSKDDMMTMVPSILSTRVLSLLYRWIEVMKCHYKVRGMV